MKKQLILLWNVILVLTLCLGCLSSVYAQAETDDYIAVLRGGVGEKTSETYVYETDKGYKYINVTSTTVSWGSPQWNHEVKKTGTVSSKEEVVEIAKKHGADSCVTYPGSFDPYPIEDFSRK